MDSECNDDMTGVDVDVDVVVVGMVVVDASNEVQLLKCELENDGNIADEQAFITQDGNFNKSFRISVDGEYHNRLQFDMAVEMRNSTGSNST